VTEFSVQALTERASEVLTDRHVFGVSQTRWEQFVGQLEQPLAVSVSTGPGVTPESWPPPKPTLDQHLSRLGEHECWAVFDGTPIVELERTTIELTNPAFATVVDEFGLRPF